MNAKFFDVGFLLLWKNTSGLHDFYLRIGEYIFMELLAGKLSEGWPAYAEIFSALVFKYMLRFTSAIRFEKREIVHQIFIPAMTRQSIVCSYTIDLEIVGEVFVKNSCLLRR